MRIVMFTEVFRGVVNGVAISVADTAEALEAAGHQVTVVAPWHPAAPKPAHNVVLVPSLPLPGNREYRLALPFFSARLWQLLISGPIDIIHVHHPFIMGKTGWLIGWLRRVPRILTYHTYLPDYAHYLPLPLTQAQRFLTWWTRFASNAADGVIAPSEPIAAYLRTIGVHSPIRVIATGIAIRHYAKKAPEAVLRRYGINPKQPILLYIGRLAPEKNVQTLVEAFRDLAAKHTTVQLLLVGDGPSAAGLKLWIQKHNLADRVFFAGALPREQTWPLFGWATIFVTASTSETQGITFDEAAAAGVARVAVGEAGALRAIRDSVDGILVDNSAQRLGQAILKLIKNPNLRKQMGVAAHKKAVANYSLEQAIIKLVSFYEALR